MKYLFLLIAFYAIMPAVAQKHTPLPHGMVFGTKPDTAMLMPAWRIEDYMGKRIRMSTTLRGRVTRVTKTKGGWFELDAGKGKIIAAHFKNIGVNIPVDLKGKIVLIEGVVQKQFIADDLQHYAGDTVIGKKQHTVKTDPKRRLIFEVEGLMVDQ
jgi:RecJ-like exonuclease